MYLELLFQTAVVIYFYILSIKRIQRVKIFSTKRDRIQNINDKRTLQLSIFFSNIVTYPMNSKFSTCKYDISIHVCSIYATCTFMYPVIPTTKKEWHIYVQL